MSTANMAMLNDDGLALDLNYAFILFMLPNILLIFLTSFAVVLLQISRGRPRMRRYIGKVANFFAKGALDRIIRDIVRHLDGNHHEQELQRTEETSIGSPIRSRSQCSRHSQNTISSAYKNDRKYDPYYLLLIPFQLDLLMTVFVYKILTRDVYFETCQSYLTTYHNRPNKVVCWLKHVNQNLSNLSFNISLHQYCANQTTTYINYEHNDVICAQYVFKAINIIDTVTNMFAWHQAIVFLVTKSIVFANWCQRRVRNTFWWIDLIQNRRRIFIVFMIVPLTIAYTIFFVFFVPFYFAFRERRRIDLTRHLIYACSKFIIANVINTNLYTLIQWYRVCRENLKTNFNDEEKHLEDEQYDSTQNNQYKNNHAEAVIHIVSD